jgi:hypothetical protein
MEYYTFHSLLEVGVEQLCLPLQMGNEDFFVQYTFHESTLQEIQIDFLPDLL